MGVNWQKLQVENNVSHIYKKWQDWIYTYLSCQTTQFHSFWLKISDLADKSNWADAVAFVQHLNQ